MKLGFFCYDNAAGDAMAILAKVAGELGYTAVLFPKQVHGAIQRALEMRDCNFVVTGLSSFQTQEELDLVAALPTEVRWVVFEDVPGACMRPLVKERGMANRAGLVLLASPAMADAARAFGYGNSVHLGPPPQWRKEYDGLMAAIAANKRAEMMFGLADDNGVYKYNCRIDNGGHDTVVGLIGGKDPEENDRIIGIVVDAIDNMYDDPVFAFSQHPGEKAERKPGMSDEEYQKEVGRFERLFAERKQILIDSDVWVADTASWKGVELAAAADVMVYASGTNISIAGAYARRPAVYLNDEGVRARIAKQSGGDGSWFVAELGGAIKAGSGEELADCLKTALSDSGKEGLRRSQEAAFPIPDDWHTEVKIIKYLEGLV